MTATAKAAGLSQRARARRAKPHLRAVIRKAPDVDPTRLKRAIKAINRADKGDDWFYFLRHVE